MPETKENILTSPLTTYRLRDKGGVSPVGVFMDALGSGINLSNYLNMMYKDASGKYIQNDAGIPADHAFPLSNGNWYDPNAIQTFIKSLS